MRPILSIKDLSWQLGTRTERLYEIADDIGSHYKFLSLLDKRKQQARHLWIPTNELKEIQRRIKNSVLEPIALGEGVHGGVRGRSPRSNANLHLGQDCVVTLDVRNFFPNVRHYVVYRMFRRDLGFGRDVARLLTRLATFKAQLPQGAPTSTAIANVLLALPLDGPISIEAQRSNVVYTRFVDDITLSGSDPRPLINTVARMLSRRRLPMHRKKAKGHSKPKLRITSRSSPQVVTGLIVNAKTGPSVARQRRDKVRAAIFDLRNRTEGPALRVAVSSIRGKIAHIRQFNPGSAERMQRYLESMLAARR